MGFLIRIDLREQAPTALVNKPVAAWINDEEGATVKTVREEEFVKFWVLVPANDDYKLRLVPKSDRSFRVFPIVAVLQSVN